MTSAKMKDCPFCGEQILEHATKCKHCKSDLNSGISTKPPQLQPSQMTVPTSATQQNEEWEECTSCKCKVPPNAKRCPHCNADLKPGCLKGVFGCLGILIILLGILLGVYSLFL